MLQSCYTREFKGWNTLASTRCNTLLHQIASCVQSSNKSCALIAAIGRSDKSPGVNASTFDGRLIKILSPRQYFVAAACRTKSIQFDFVRHVAATKFCRDEICCCDVFLGSPRTYMNRRCDWLLKTIKDNKTIEI